MPGTHPRRRAALRTSLQAAELDAMLVTDLLNIRYLTGFTGSNAALLVASDGDDGSVFCTDGRYDTQSERQVPDLRRVIDRRSDLALMAAATEAEFRRVGFESHRVTVDGHAML